MVRIVIAGGSGFVGQRLTAMLLEQGHEIVILSRKARDQAQGKVSYVKWLSEGAAPQAEIGHAQCHQLSGCFD